jgi:hypothetical protein
MSEEYTYKWVRIRTCHSSGTSVWSFREVEVPANLTKPSRRADLDKWFRDNIAPELDHELSTQSEHWRGIEWDWSPIPRHRMANRILSLKQEIKHLREQIKRYEADLHKLPEQTKPEDNKRRCRQFPNCGCIKQFKMSDCREPYEWELKYILQHDEQRAKKAAK